MDLTKFALWQADKQEAERKRQYELKTKKCIKEAEKVSSDIANHIYNLIKNGNFESRKSNYGDKKYVKLTVNSNVSVAESSIDTFVNNLMVRDAFIKKDIGHVTFYGFEYNQNSPVSLKKEKGKYVVELYILYTEDGDN